MKIKELRKRKGMTQNDLAEKLGLTQQTVATWENGTREPQRASLITMADLFGVTLDDLLGRVPNVDSYTVNEEAIIKEFQSLTPEQQLQVIEYAKFLQKK